MKNRGSSLWKESMNQPNLVYLGQNKKKNLSTNPYLGQGEIQMQKLKPSDMDLNRDESFDFESIAG